jgi:hypothetical protein
MKIAKADLDDPMEFAQNNEYPVVFKWPAQQSQASKHVYLTVKTSEHEMSEQF